MNHFFARNTKNTKKLRLWNAWFVMIKLFSVDFICYKYKPIHLFVSENYYIEKKNKMNLWRHIIYKHSAGIMNEHRRRNPSFTGCQANSAALSKCTKRQIEWTNHTEKNMPQQHQKQQMPQNKNRSPIKTQITRNKTKENFSHIHTPKKNHHTNTQQLCWNCSLVICIYNSEFLKGN